jgi:hypothetical protein
MTSTSQTQTKKMKQIISDEIKDIFVLDYNFDVAYNIIDDTSGNSYGGGDTVNISDVKYFTTEKQMKEFLSSVKECPNEALDSCYNSVDTIAEYSHIEEDNSTSKKISLIDYFNTDSNSCLRYLNEFLRNNPDYELVGDFKLVKKTNLTK